MLTFLVKIKTKPKKETHCVEQSLVTFLQQKLAVFLDHSNAAICFEQLGPYKPVNLSLFLFVHIRISASLEPYILF